MSNQQTKPRQWLIQAEPVVIDANDQDLLFDELQECVMLLRRVGGAITIQTDAGNLVLGAIREQSEEMPDFYVTTHFVAKWTPSLPSARRVRPDPPLAHEEPEDDMRDQDEAEVAAVLEPVES